MVEVIEEETKILQKESIKLSRGMKGFYSWEVKILPIGEALDDNDMARLDKLNSELTDKYGATE